MSEPACAYLEDFALGQTFTSGVARMDKARMIAFAEEFDPQVAHIDEQGARATQFGRLVASGWHTAAVAMRLMIADALPPIEGGGVGAGVEQLSWPAPVLPDDELRLTAEVTGNRALRSRPGKGIVTVRVELANQADVVVLRMVTSMVVPARPA